MKLPLPRINKIANLPPFFHPNLLETIRLDDGYYVFRKNFTGKWDLEPQKEALKACLQKALGISVDSFFELSNPGFFQGYPLRGVRISPPQERNIVKSPLFSRVCWFPFDRKELLFILKSFDEARGKKVINLLGEKGCGKSWIIRRAIEMSENGILLDGNWKNLTGLAEKILRERKWRIIGIENFGNGVSTEIFKILYLSSNDVVFVLEGESEEGVNLKINPPSFKDWKNSLVTLDEETKEVAFSLLKEDTNPRRFIEKLFGEYNERPSKVYEDIIPDERISTIDEIESLLDEGNYEEALCRLEDLQEDSGIYLLLKGKILLALGERDGAKKLLDKSGTKIGHAISCYLEGRDFEVRNDDPPEVFLWAGKKEESKGNFLSAEGYFRKAYKSALDKMDTNLAGRIASDLGVLFYRRNNLKEAEKFFRSSIVLLSSAHSPKLYTIASFNLAEVLFRLGRWGEAENLYRLSYNKGLKSTNSISHAYDCAALGYVLYLRGQFKEGKELLSKALKVFYYKGTREEISDLALKIFEISLDGDAPPPEILKKKLNYPAEKLRLFFGGEAIEGDDPWSLLLNGLRFKRKKDVLKAAQRFSNYGKEVEEYLSYYLMVKNGLWGRREIGKLRKTMKWYRERGSYRAEIIEKELSRNNFEADVKVQSVKEPFSFLLSKIKDEIPGDIKGIFLLDKDGNILEKKVEGNVPWKVIREYNSPQFWNDWREHKDEESKQELYLKGIKSYVICGVPYKKGMLIGFSGSEAPGEFSGYDLSRMKEILNSGRNLLFPDDGFILFKGNSWEMRKVYSMLERAALDDYSVLIQGETGTGKDLAARVIHRIRGQGKFVTVNCAAIPENLLESELFGYKAGAFTDAKRDKKGIFEEAIGGVVFLDEIGEMPLSLQAKLLRVIQERRVRRLGDNREISVEFKLVAATNQNLSGLMEKGYFRRDLYFRLSTHLIEIPPLRERKEDIMTLAHYFASHIKKKRISFSSEVKKVFLSYDWPGNVRELENVVKRGITFMEGGENIFLIQHLPPYLRNSQRVSLTLEKAKNLWERDFILSALESNSWEITFTAKQLGISRQHLYNLIKKHKLK